MSNHNENTENKHLKDFGSMNIKGKHGNIFCISIIGQIEGHIELPGDNKTTKYEHLIPLIVAIEEDENIALSAGIHAVPFYLFDGKYSIPGALSYDDFKSVLSQIMAESEVDEDKDTDNCANGVCAI